MSKRPAGDEHMGRFVYCKAHVSPHSTGWRTVPPDDKIPLKAQIDKDAFAGARAMGLPIYGEESYNQRSR